MLKYQLLFVLLIAGCAVQPTPTKPIKQVEATPNKPAYTLYVPPEEIWPEDYQSPPKVCASPFRGSILER